MHKLPELPYAHDALEPIISAKTLEIHHGKHHQAYVTNLNALVKGSPLETSSLEDLIMATYNDPSSVAIFNNAAQVWNHTFYWNCLTPQKQKPSNQVVEKISHTFGSLDAFLKEFKQAALTQFGSGWAWLVKEGDALKIVKTSNAQVPMTMGQTALFTCDVWEHAYYLDYQNRRPDYVDALLTDLINWEFIEKNLNL